jgi:hypothetical protein
MRQFLIFVLFFDYCFGEIMFIRDSYVCQKGDLCVFIHEVHIRSVTGYCFVRNYAAIPVQLEIVILQYIYWCACSMDFFLQSIQLLLPVSDG